MPHLLTESPTRLLDELLRRQNAHDVDIKRLWRRVQQLEQVLVAAGLTIPEEE